MLKADDLTRNMTLKDRKWVVAKPIPQSLSRRILDAIQVIKGKAEAVTFNDQERLIMFYKEALEYLQSIGIGVDRGDLTLVCMHFDEVIRYAQRVKAGYVPARFRPCA